MNREAYFAVTLLITATISALLMVSIAHATPRAQQVYERSWEQAKHLFPPRASAPTVRFLSADEHYPKPTPRAAMWVEWKPSLLVFITPGQSRALASAYAPARRAAQKRLLHEWVHFHQPMPKLGDDLRPLEYEASQFARRYAYLFKPAK